MLKWGSYHLGKPGDPVKQADFYLATAKPAADEVMALDIESLDPARDMSLANARRFIRRIKAKTGRYPMFYANHAVTKAVSDKFGRDDVFSKTHLWYARFHVARHRLSDEDLGLIHPLAVLQRNQLHAGASPALPVPRTRHSDGYGCERIQRHCRRPQSKMAVW